jgi:site-specific DNA-cytosine methylase
MTSSTSTGSLVTTHEFTHFHAFAGLGAAAKGFNAGHARVGSMQAKFRCIGGFDVDPSAVRDFERMSGAKGTVLDAFSREQYVAFHGHEPPPDWREATPEDIRRAAGWQRPSVCFTSAPCKGFSGLLSETRSKTAKYQALNQLTLRGIWLCLEAWADDPPDLWCFENVPRIATSRGRDLLDRISAMLRAYGYATAESSHDCGELGGLAQSRKRFLLVARHTAKVQPLLYEPPKRALRGVGEVIGRIPLPNDESPIPMHRMPRLSWATWVRLAFVEAGSDWRSLNRLNVVEGRLRDYLIVPTMFRGALGVRRWDQHVGTVAGESLPFNGAFACADPRFTPSAAWNDGQAYGVHTWSQHTGAIAGQQAPGQGAYAVADPRHLGPAKHSNEFRIVQWSGHSMAVTSAHGSGQAVADPRPTGELFGKYAVTSWNDAAGTVIAGSTTGQGAFAVADPRSGMAGDRDAYLTGGHYGVVPWSEPSGAVSAAACHDNGRWSVADPRMPTSTDKLVAVIRSLDETWHRPFTTYELACLQSLVEPEEHLELDGLSDQAWRERIGNAVPCDAAQAVASEMGRTLLLAKAGESFQLSSVPIWVRNIAVGLAVQQPQVGP